jgi:hypothetical protein
MLAHSRIDRVFSRKVIRDLAFTRSRVTWRAELPNIVMSVTYIKVTMRTVDGTASITDFVYIYTTICKVTRSHCDNRISSYLALHCSIHQGSGCHRPKVLYPKGWRHHKTSISIVHNVVVEHVNDFIADPGDQGENPPDAYRWRSNSSTSRVKALDRTSWDYPSFNRRVFSAWRKFCLEQIRQDFDAEDGIADGTSRFLWVVLLSHCCWRQYSFDKKKK